MERVQKNPNREKFNEFRNQTRIFFKAALKIIKDNFPKNSPHLIRIQNKLKSLPS